MLENMRNHAQSWLAKIILGGIALSFVLWGIGDYFLGSRVETVAEVDGNPITDSEFQLAYQRELDNYRRILGKSFSKKMVEQLGLKEVTLQTLINRRLMLDEAREMGLVAPHAVLVARVQSTPAFLSNGRFDTRRYEILTRNMGYRTPADYEATLKLDMMVDALQRAIMDSATVSDEAVRARFAHDYEQRVLEALIVRPEDMQKQVHVTDAQARAWYEAHKSAYKTPLRLKLAAVVIDPAAIARNIEVDEADIEAWWKEHQDQFAVPEQRHARHILVKLPKHADAAARARAQKRIEAALKALRAGQPFERVARKYSEDAATAKKGGDLGWFGKGVMVKPFEQAVFSMKKGQISDIVETPFGFHVIQLVDIRPAHVKPLAEARDEIRRQLARDKADDEAYQLSQDLDDALGREDSLETAAASLNLKVRTIGPISMDEARADALLGRDAAFRAQVFAMQPGAPVEVTELNDGRFAAVEVKRRIEPETLPFARVVKRVYDEARADAARKAARKKAEAVLAEADHLPAARLGQRHGLPLYVSKPVRANGVGDADAAWLSRNLLQAAFETPEGAYAPRVIALPQGFAIVRVKRVIKADDKTFAKAAPAIRAQLKRQAGSVRFARWMSSVRSRHEIEIHQDVLARF